MFKYEIHFYGFKTNFIETTVPIKKKLFCWIINCYWSLAVITRSIFDSQWNCESVPNEQQQQQLYSYLLSPPGAIDDITSQTQGRPRFLLEPDAHYYIVKNKAATLTCKASSAVQIHFKCAGQWVRPEHHITLQLEDDAGMRYLQTTIEVTRIEVEEYYGVDGYSCQCHAWNSQHDGNEPQSAKSRFGLVQVASEWKCFMV